MLVSNNSTCYLFLVVLCVCVCVYVIVAQLCPTLCDPMDYSLPGSSVHGILQARIVEWVDIPFSRWSSRHRDWTQLSYTTSEFFFSFIFISWRLITLQYCSGFCHILTWISHGFTCIQATPPAQLQKNKWPNQKMGWRTKQTFLQGRHTDS